MNYITSRALSEKWNISQRRIVRLALSGRIDGAKLYGKNWLFPEDAPKPTDGRTKAGIAEKQKESDTFRYPIFEYKDAASFQPPLSREEQTIKAVMEAFYAFRFQDGVRLLGDLPERTEDRYIRIVALYCGCMAGIILCDTKRFFDCYGKLKAELQKEFPHKAEMSEYLHEIEASLGADAYYADDFHNKPTYIYHESFLPRLCNLSALWLALGRKQITSEDFMAYELNCSFLEKTDNYFDLQALHIYLACAYSMTDEKEKCNYHFRRALLLAEKYDLFYTFGAMQYYHKPKALRDALEGFPEDFKKRLTEYNRTMRKCHERFTDTIKYNSIYKMVSNDDYIYIEFAVQNLTNSEVAKRMHLSAATVSKHYAGIYAQLNVKNKTELTALYHRLTDNTVTVQSGADT